MSIGAGLVRDWGKGLAQGRLFPEGMDESVTLALTGCKTDRDGVVLLTYQPAPAKAPAGQPGAAD